MAAMKRDRVNINIKQIDSIIGIDHAYSWSGKLNNINRYWRKSMKTIKFLRSLFIGALLAGASTFASAIPTLQLGIVGGTYNAATQTIVSSGPVFSLYAFLNPDPATSLGIRITCRWPLPLRFLPRRAWVPLRSMAIPSTRPPT